MINKKGELTTQQLVTIIILIVSFSIILFFILRLNLGETSNKEICHSSVIMKAKSITGTGYLDCRTNYVCISGGGECENFTEDYQIEINLNQEPDKIKNQTMKAIADEMADCWWMFGEGKVDYVGTKFSGDSSCALCSVISFDKKIEQFSKSLNDKISYPFLYEKYLPSNKKDGESYLYYLYETINYSKIDYPKDNFDFSKQYSILTGIYKKGYLGKVFSAPWSFVESLFVDKDGKTKETGPLSVIIKKKEDINSLGCSEFITKA